MLAAVALGASSVAQASVIVDGATGFGPKVDESVVGLANSAPSTSSKIRVLVFGRNLGEARADADAKARRTLWLVRGQSMAVEAGLLRELVRHRSVVYVTADIPMRPTADALEPFSFPLLSNLYPEADGAPEAWNKGLSGSGVGIAVLDSGARADAAFGSRMTQVHLSGQTAVDDAYGHGTFVSAVAAGKSLDGRYVGIAPGASVYAINVTGADGSLYASDVIAGLDWVLAHHVEHNIRVVNISLAESVASSYLESALDTAVERLWRSGVVVVASAGNRGADQALYAPGNDPFVLTVGSLDTDGTVATFSSRGTTGDGFSKPELLAPGRRIVSRLPGDTTLGQQVPLTNVVAPGYAQISGTSFSAPQVAGAAAILLEQHPDWTPDQVKWILIDRAASVNGASGRRLDLGQAASFMGTPQSANEGVVPTSYGLVGTSTTDFNSATWNSATWNSATWNSATWNSATWNSATWNSFSWE